jgi:hypothetical protein
MKAVDGQWALMVPPERPYAADRDFVMGGPLASKPMEGADFHGAYYSVSTAQLDTNAPLAQWKPMLGVSSQTKSDCEQLKAQLIAQANDPKWLAEQAQTVRTRNIDSSGYRDELEAAQCVQQ